MLEVIDGDQKIARKRYHEKFLDNNRFYKVDKVRGVNRLMGKNVIGEPYDEKWKGCRTSRIFVRMIKSTGKAGIAMEKVIPPEWEPGCIVRRCREMQSRNYRCHYVY